VPLAADIDGADVACRLRAALLVDNGDATAAESAVFSVPGSGDRVLPPSTFVSRRFRKRCTVCSTQRDMLSVLDAALVADVVVLALSAQHANGYDEHGDVLLSALKAQGVSSTMHIVTGFPDRTPPAQVHERTRTLCKAAAFHFPTTERVFSVASPSEAQVAARAVAETRMNPLSWRMHHAYVLAEQVAFVPNTDSLGKGTLSISGYVRGRSLCATAYMHIPDVGDFRISHIDGPVDPTPMRERRPAKSSAAMSVSEDASTGATLARADLAALDAEIGEDIFDRGDDNADSRDGMDDDDDDDDDDDVDDDGDDQMHSSRGPGSVMSPSNAAAASGAARVVRVPKGTSSYQAAWFLESSAAGTGGAAEDGEDAVSGDGMDDGDDARGASSAVAPQTADDDDGDEDSEFEDVAVGDTRVQAFDNQLDITEHDTEYVMRREYAV
jgi:pre-rRNA-processing protein TSR1